MAATEQNARNALENRLREIGLVAEAHCTVRCTPLGDQRFEARVQVRLPTGETLEATGAPSVGKGPTKQSACGAMLALLGRTHPQYFVDWETHRVDAQRGDALIKLAAYLVDDPETAAQTSTWLQASESNPALARVFDAWRAAGDPELLQWGTHLSVHRKGTLVEALIWRRFGARILAPDAVDQLALLRAALAPE